jgi:sterol desaturase/sphingolipid hydroxylase (fatty acid hydroxylase superfamily)
LDHVHHFLQRFTALLDYRPHKPAAFLSLAGLSSAPGLLAPRTTMKSNALLLLAVCLFAAFAAAWTKEGTYYNAFP